MKNKWPQAGNDEDSADEQKDRYEGFSIHSDRVMVVNITVSGIGRREKNILSLIWKSTEIFLTGDVRQMLDSPDNPVRPFRTVLPTRALFSLFIGHQSAIGKIVRQKTHICSRDDIADKMIGC